MTEVLDFVYEEGEGPRVFDPERPTPPVTPRQIDRDTVYYGASTDRNLGEIAALVSNNMGRSLTTEAENVVNGNLRQTSEAEFDTEQLVGTIQEMQEVELFRRFLPDSMIEALRANAPGSQTWATRTISRLLMAGDMIQEREEQMRGVGTTVLDAAELLIDPLDIVHQGTYRRLTGEFEALLASSVTPEEFQSRMSGILDQAADAGFFSNENRFYFGGFLSTLGAGVYSPEQAANEAFAVADLALTGALEGLTLTRRGLLATTSLTAGYMGRGFAQGLRDIGQDSLSALGVMRPSNRTNEVVEEYLSTYVNIDDPNLASRVPNHTQAGVSTPTLERGLMWSAPSHQAVREFEIHSAVLQDFRSLRRDAGGIFDDVRINELAARFEPARLAHLRNNGNTRIIDVEVGLDDADNIVALDVLGTTRGQYFRTQGNAERVAEFGDEVVQVGEGQWAVIHRNNIMPTLDNLPELGYTDDLAGFMLYRSTDPANLGNGWWGRWGSPLAQTTEEIASALYRGESIMQRALHQINERTKRITRGLRARQITEVYEMFEAQQASPVTSAWSRSRFETEFYSRFNREPTDGQTALYLLQQERLDVQLFIDADNVYKTAVNMGASVLRIDGTQYVVTRQSRQTLDDTAAIYDVDNGRLITAADLEEGRTVYRVQGNDDFPMNVQYAVSQEPEIRAVRHSDFFVRNSGGHRAYIVNDMQFLVKQRNVHNYEDGSTRELAPRTVLGARTRQEADAARTDINNILDEIHTALPVGRRTADEYRTELASLGNGFDNVIVRNNGFHPGLQGLDDFLQFASDRGLDLRTKFDVVAEGQPLEKYAQGIGANPYIPRGITQGDEVRMNIQRGGRGTLPLMGYGNTQVTTRSTQEAIEGSYMSSIMAATETTYRIRAGEGLINAALDSGVMRAGYDEIRHLPLRTRLQRIKDEKLIDTSGARGADENVGPRLQLELERLMFRLQRDSWTMRKWNDTMRRFGNFLYGKNFKAGARWADRRSSDPLTALRGWAFDAYLGMFNISQILMQSVQVVNIVGIAGFNAIKGGAMYGPMRFALANGHPEVIRRAGRLMQRVSGMEPEDFETMVEMFRRSGRGYVDNNIAEMTQAEDMATRLPVAGDIGRAVNQRVRDFRESGRIFFKEGDLVARITAFNTAFLEYTAKHGRITRADDRQAIQWITHREQVLTQGMTAASRQAYEQLPFMQFMTYQLRINEALFAGTFSNAKSVLTGWEKIKLAFTHLAMFGFAASTVSSFAADYYASRYDMEINDTLWRFARGGLLDGILSMVSGADVAASSRFSSSEGLWRSLRDIAQNHPAEFAIGPSGELATNTLSLMYNTARSVMNGNVEDTQVRIQEFVRITSSGNYTMNAITALRTGQYLSRQWGYISDDIDPTEAVFLAFGIPLEEIDSIYRYRTQDRLMGQWRRHMAQRMTRMWNLHLEAARRGDWDRANEYMHQLSIAYGSLDPWELEEVERFIRRDGIPMNDRVLLELIQRDVQLQRSVE